MIPINCECGETIFKEMFKNESLYFCKCGRVFKYWSSTDDVRRLGFKCKACMRSNRRLEKFVHQETESFVCEECCDKFEERYSGVLEALRKTKEKFKEVK